MLEPNKPGSVLSPSDSEESKNKISMENVPRDIKLMSILLQSRGVEECDQNVVHQLLEFGYRKYYVSLGQFCTSACLLANKGDVQTTVLCSRFDHNHNFMTAIGYTVDVLQDALIYAEHAGKHNIDMKDVRLAIQGRVNYSFTSPPDKEVVISDKFSLFLLELATERNKQPLPLIPEKYGVRLPPEKHTLTGINFQIVPEKRIQEQYQKQQQQ
ncbi:Transcription initiation factor TFIID subunit 9 [Spiromyces aspiralis]|uniref:Transcription initiation factor TFIID subunit 9 n=1 Tax=Spiromyces aspiralis TaxID=68401 RepID=A0ACC1HL63_9FUNG|nr:Transcription initiation factor TFIID subunit 9 [Spiromyces aspiralis]